jgi:hypothetical protein
VQKQVQQPQATSRSASPENRAKKHAAKKKKTTSQKKKKKQDKKSEEQRSAEGELRLRRALHRQHRGGQTYRSYRDKCAESAAANSLFFCVLGAFAHATTLTAFHTPPRL